MQSWFNYCIFQLGPSRQSSGSCGWPTADQTTGLKAPHRLFLSSSVKRLGLYLLFVLNFVLGLDSYIEVFGLWPLHPPQETHFVYWLSLVFKGTICRFLRETLFVCLCVFNFLGLCKRWNQAIPESDFWWYCFIFSHHIAFSQLFSPFPLSNGCTCFYLSLYIFIFTLMLFLTEFITCPLLLVTMYEIVTFLGELCF